MRKTSQQDEQNQKARYLRALGKTGTLTAGCRAARCSPHTVYKWREHDTAFSIQERDTREAFADLLEEKAVKRATQDDSDTLLIFLLKAVRPEKFRERVQLQHADSNGEKFPLRLVREALGISIGHDSAE